MNDIGKVTIVMMTMVMIMMIIYSIYKLTDR